METPSPARTGIPSTTTAISVVVPPMSTMTAFFSSVSPNPPITLAAGPQSSVSTGCRRANCSLIRLPSLRMMTTGAASPRAFITFSTARIKSRMTGYNCAFKRVPAPRCKLLSSLNSSQPQVTGTSERFCSRSFAPFSMTALLRMAYSSMTPTPSAFFKKAGASFSNFFQSGGCGILPSSPVLQGGIQISEEGGRPYCAP